MPCASFFLIIFSSNSPEVVETLTRSHTHTDTHAARLLQQLQQVVSVFAFVACVCDYAGYTVQVNIDRGIGREAEWMREGHGICVIMCACRMPSFFEQA